MNKILQLRLKINASTVKLAGTYLAIIMFMSICFSIVFYQVSVRELDRPLSPQVNREIRENEGENAEQSIVELSNALQSRSDEARRSLLTQIISVNVLALITGGILSCVLARISLRPIEENMEAQEQFVSDASHELRTPLTVIQSTNEVALKKNSLSQKEARKLLQYNVEEVQKLQDLSSSLLQLLKGDAKPQQLEEVEVQNVVSRSMEHIVTQAQQKDITIDDQTPRLKVLTSSEMLVRLLSILLENAVKYSEDGKTVVVSAVEAKNTISISVADRGIGIRESDLKYIFRRFYRADKSRTRLAEDVSGYGLGLSIAKKIAIRLDAQLSVKSDYGKGSTFTITLPASRS